MNKESLKEYLSSRYQGWNSFLSNVIFPIFGENDFEDGFETELLESQPERRQLAEATGIRSIKQVGMMYVGVEPLQIFDVTVSDRVMMERNRVNIQRLIRAVMDQFSCAFMLFHYEDDTRWDWRFTYCRKSGNKEETTDSKRYTFLLGPGQSCRTATDNFMALYDKRDSLEIKDIEDAFNVEALSKEFFGKYKAQYEAFVNYMVDPANGMRQDFIDTDFDHTGMKVDKIRDREEKPIRDYVKKLLGRIVFLHFLQKKGWLGVPAGKEWGEGDRDFMLNIFKNATERQKENFLDDILEDLFGEGLDRNRSDRGDLYDTKVEGFRNCRIPYLNGGLFERDNLDKKPSHFPASYFDGLLTMLSQYNFTIDENDPNDAEVGVDPEMLGRIFENLLEDNKDKGAFYTPKEIVQYMCRESLIAYLQTDQREEDKNCIRQDEKSPEALPNLDFKIMQGNSLLEQYKGADLSTMTEKKVGAGQGVTIFDSMLDVYRKNLRDKLTEYYACLEHDKKAQLRKDIADIVKQELDEQGIRIDFEDMDLSANSQFFLWHTWFHDVFSRPSNGGGFDITIGNPPYISAPTQIASPELNEQRQRIVASKKYKSLNEKWDLYVPFMELGMQLLCPNGVFSMIVPYPLTNQKYGKKLRKMIAEEYRLLEIADLNGTKIFENATVSNCIPFIQSSQPEGELRITKIFEDKTIREVLSKSPEALKQDEKNYVWNLTEEERTGNHFANMNVLGDFCYISKGMVVNAHENIEKGAFKKEDLISLHFDDVHSRKYLEAKDIDKYQVRRVRYLEWNTERCPDKLSRPTFRELYDRPKLIMNCLGTINVTIDIKEHFLHNHSIYCAILWKDLKGVNNKSISSSIKKFCKHNRADMETLSGNVDLYYLLGILNSSMANQLLADQRGGDYHIYPEHIRNLPIPVPQRDAQNAIGVIAKEILLRREENIDYSELEEQLNGLVAVLYQ